MTAQLGMDAKLYYNTSGAGSGGWTLLGNCTDVTLSTETAEADVTTRGNNGWRAVVGTLKEGSVEFEMIWDTEDTDFVNFSDAFFNKTVMGLAVLDRVDGAGAQGLVGDFQITNFTRTEPLEEAMKVQVTAKLTFSANAPQWVDGGTGSYSGSS